MYVVLDMCLSACVCRKNTTSWHNVCRLTFSQKDEWVRLVEGEKRERGDSNRERGRERERGRQTDIERSTRRNEEFIHCIGC